MSKERKLDLFGILTKINKKDQQYYLSLSEDEQKEVIPLLLMRWLTGTSDFYQICLINEYINTYVFSLYKHKDLLTKLLLCSVSGKNNRYSWVKTKSKKGTIAPLSCSIISKYYQISSKQAIDYLKLLTEIDIIDYAEQLGYQSDDITKLKKELKIYYTEKD